jgi:hypothetical protein
MGDGAQGSNHIPLKVAGFLLLAVALLASLLLFPRSWTETSTPSAPPVAADPLDAYRGLGTWIDIYDTRAWTDPKAVVQEMAGHGVRTLFIQTGNSSSKEAVHDPLAQETFIREAHARGMKVVAWYLPSMVDAAFDFDRIQQAIRFKTSDGQTFDSFALDIESAAIHDVNARNAAVDALSTKIRDMVGPSYILGGIVPSPVGIAKKAHFWDDFPYGAVAKDFDVLVPMGYYTFHGKGAAAAEADALGNMRILRAQPGCATIPVHLIGGLAAKTTDAEVEAFANATQTSGCIGASLYSWAGTTSADWIALQVIRR